ncbi:hypothetical protein ACI8AA_01525 [Geodermatophilus sp. SYSU D01180]
MIRTPDAGELIDAWDAGSSLHPVHRSGPLLRAVTGLEPDALAELDVGERDRVLIQVRERLFGHTLRALADCPSCGLVFELELTTSALFGAERGPDVVGVDVAGYSLRCRVPRMTDLAEAAAAGSASAARALLVARAVLSAERGGTPVAAADLPDDVVQTAAAALAVAEPLADVELPISCDACGTTWHRPLDIDSYLWRELDAWAERLIGDVHALATAYGWSESQVLALSPRRRRRYLELVGHG